METRLLLAREMETEAFGPRFEKSNESMRGESGSGNGSENENGRGTLLHGGVCVVGAG